LSDEEGGEDGVSCGFVKIKLRILNGRKQKKSMEKGNARGGT